MSETCGLCCGSLVGGGDGGLLMVMEWAGWGLSWNMIVTGSLNVLKNQQFVALLLIVNFDLVCNVKCAR